MSEATNEQMMIDDYDTGEAASFSMSFINVGVGPAKVRSLRLEIGGQAISDRYCSIFDECWLADSRLDLQQPEPVEMCPDFREESFVN